MDSRGCHGPAIRKDPKDFVARSMLLVMFQESYETKKKPEIQYKASEHSCASPME